MEPKEGEAGSKWNRMGTKGVEAEPNANHREPK